MHCLDQLFRATLLVFCCLVPATALAWNYPETSGYSAIPTIDTEELHKALAGDGVLIIDVRSRIEFNTAHINGAEHVPLANRSFIATLTELVRKNTPKLLVFYCNGGSCLKAPEAVVKSGKAGIKNGVAYYEGLPGWAANFPDETLLRGKPVSVANSLIPDKEFTRRCLSFDDFKAKIAEAGDRALVVDVRDHIQNSGQLPGLDKVLAVPLDNFIPNFLRTGKSKDQTMFLFDQVGLQVRSLQYELRENDYKDFWFLDKGATAVLSEQHYK